MALIGAGVDSFLFGTGIDGDVLIDKAANYHTTSLNAFTASGPDGVGHTLTANANGALSISGASPSVGQRVLYNVLSVNGGIYTVSDTGSAGTPWILVRATDYDAIGDISVGQSIFITSGSVYRMNNKCITVACATTANISLSGTPILDGVQTKNGDFVLVKDQSSPAENGIYVVTSGVSAEWIRHTDAFHTGDFSLGLHAYVVNGSVGAGTYWYFSALAPTMGSTSLSVVSTTGIITFGFSMMTFSLISIDRDWEFNSFKISVALSDTFFGNNTIYIPFVGGRMFVKTGIDINIRPVASTLGVNFISLVGAGSNGSGTTGGAAGTGQTAVTVGGSTSGGAGGSELLGANGAAYIAGNTGILGGRGGSGGTGSGGSPAGGTSAATSWTTNRPHQDLGILHSAIVNSYSSGLTQWLITGGSGGGGGGAPEARAGGGGGAGGGVVWLCTPRLQVTFSNVGQRINFLAAGGEGGIGTALAGSGGGGGGGVVILLTGEIRRLGLAGSIVFNTKGGNATNDTFGVTAGTGGRSLIVNLQSGAVTEYTGKDGSVV